MSNTELDLNKEIKALSPIQQQIRSICDNINLDTEAAETFAAKSGFSLPWHESVSPRASLGSARKILDTPPTSEQAALDVVDYFVNSDICSKVPVGLVGALAAASNQFWDAPAKAGFLIHFPLEVYKDFTRPSVEPGFDVDPDGVRGALCWLVHDVLAVEALHKLPLSKESSQVIDILVKHAVILLADCAYYSTGDDDIIDALEKTLTNLARQHSGTGPRVAQLLKVLNEDSQDVDNRTPPEIRLHEDLQRLYPDPFLKPDLSGERILEELSAETKAYRAALALTNFSQDSITSKPEWSNPLGAAADELKTKKLVRLDLRSSDLLTSAKAREVLFEILSQAPDTKLALPVDLFFKRAPSDPTYEDLASELNLCIERGQNSCLVSKTSQSNFDIRKVQTFEFLNSVTELLGYKQVKVVSPADTQLDNTSEASHICLIDTSGAKVGAAEGKVTINLNKREPEASWVAGLKELLDRDSPKAITAGHIQSAICQTVVPTLGQQDMPRDKHGLNGVRPKAIGLTLSEMNIEGVGRFPKLLEADFKPTDRGLVIMYNGQHEGPEEELPINAEDAPREEERDSTDKLVGSKR